MRPHEPSVYLFTNQEMSAGLNISGAVDLLLLLDYEFNNIFKKNTDNASILNVPSHSFENTHYNIYLHLSNSFTVNHNRKLIAKPEFYNRLLFFIF